MNYLLRKTAQGLMLYGSEMENPKMYGYGYNDHTLPEWYKTFQPICPIHKEHEEAFMCYALKLKYNEIYTADAVAKLIEGIEIPSERVGFQKYGICCAMSKDYPYHTTECGSCDNYKEGQYAILLPEKKLPEKKEEEIIKTYTESDLRAAFGKGYARGYQQRDCEENYNPITGFEPKNKEATFEEFFKSLK